MKKKKNFINTWKRFMKKLRNSNKKFQKFKTNIMKYSKKN